MSIGLSRVALALEGMVYAVAIVYIAIAEWKYLKGDK